MTGLVAWLASMFAFASIMSITPGPNNLMVAASGVTYGLRRTLSHIFGVSTGTALQLLLVAAGLGAILEHHPWTQTALKVAGTLYLLWMAWHLWRSNELADGDAREPFGFWRAAAFQLVNPKAWVVALGFVAAFLTPGDAYWWQAAVGMGFRFLGTFQSTLVWGAFGAGLRRWLSDPRALRAVSRALALLTALTVVLFWV